MEQHKQNTDSTKYSQYWDILVPLEYFAHTIAQLNTLTLLGVGIVSFENVT